MFGLFVLAVIRVNNLYILMNSRFVGQSSQGEIRLLPTKSKIWRECINAERAAMYGEGFLRCDLSHQLFRLAKGGKNRGTLAGGGEVCSYVY